MHSYLSLFAAVVPASLVLAVPQTAAAAEPGCITPREFSALAGYALPSVITGAARACAPSLPGGSYLRQSGAQLAQRYAAGRTRAWPEAKAAFIRMSTAGEPAAAQMFTAMPDDTLQQLMDAAFAGIVGGQVKPAECPTIDRVVTLLAPLPAENTAELIALAVGLGSKGGPARLGKLTVCKA